MVLSFFQRISLEFKSRLIEDFVPVFATIQGHRSSSGYTSIGLNQQTHREWEILDLSKYIVILPVRSVPIKNCFKPRGGQVFAAAPNEGSTMRSANSLCTVFDSAAFLSCSWNCPRFLAAALVTNRPVSHLAPEFSTSMGTSADCF